MEQVKIYSTGFCHVCKVAKAWFKEKGIAFNEILFEENPAEFQAMQDETLSMNVPVIKIGNEWIIGFAKERIAKLLGIQ